MRLSDIMNEIIDGVEPEYDWSGLAFDARVEVMDPKTGELDIHLDIEGWPQVSLQIGDMAFEYNSDGWEVTDWGGDVSQNDCIEKNDGYYCMSDECDGDGMDVRAIEALPNILNQYWSNPYRRQQKAKDVDEDQFAEVEFAVEQTDFTRFYDVGGVFYGRRDGMADVEGIDFSTVKPMDATAFAWRLIRAKLKGEI